MAAITSTGFGSGLPINDLVTQLVAAEGSPAKSRIDRREATLQTQLSSIGLLKGALSEFQSAVKKLSTAESFTNRTASSSDTKVATFTSTQSATQGSYQLEVERLASAQKLVGQQGYNNGDTGRLTFSNASGRSFSVDINSSNASLEGIRDSINQSSSNFGVTATILNLNDGPRLVLTANETGEENRITSISSNSTQGNLSVFDYTYDETDPENIGSNANFQQVTAGDDARFRLEGQLLTTASNTIDNAIPGTTITLKDVTELNKPITLNVSTSTSNVRTAIEGFVSAYNKLQTFINGQTNFNESTGSAGTLLGDALTRTVQSQIRGVLGSQVSDAGAISSLTQLGITTNRNGSLEISASRLNQALDNNFESVTALFSGNNGLAARLDNTLKGYLQRNGVFDNRTESLNSQIKGLDTEREVLSRRLDRLETRLFAQFNAMDSIVAQLNNTGNYLTQQLESISQISNFRNNRR